MPPRAARSSYAGTAGLLLAVEVVSRGSEVTDRIVKKVEYAKAGIGRYWIIERDGVAAVHRHILNGETCEYESGPEEGPVQGRSRVRDARPRRGLEGLPRRSRRRGRVHHVPPGERASSTGWNG
ncbi:Uma2 family endonuclease [Actinoplanes sp. NPDC049118]|uniref:Uma2 family endonuclease n=1 Tax=Actinoplanes sp. NPDC049118 TaxID=3155769 RepID=UPI0033CCB5B1